MTSQTAPAAAQRFAIELSEHGHRLKDYDHPSHAKSSKPLSLRGRFSWLGPLRDDYTRYTSQEEATTALAALEKEMPDMKGRFVVNLDR